MTKERTINTKQLRKEGVYEGWIYSKYTEDGKRIEQEVPISKIKSSRYD